MRILFEKVELTQVPVTASPTLSVVFLGQATSLHNVSEIHTEHSSSEITSTLNTDNIQNNIMSNMTF